jgi:hypothetical protein
MLWEIFIREYQYYKLQYIRYYNGFKSYLYLFNFRFSKMTHVGTRLLIHKWCIFTIWFRQSNLIWNVGVSTLLSSGFRSKWWIILLNHLFLKS